MAVLMQTEVKAEPESANEGRSEEGMRRKLGTMDLNQGVGERSSLNHWPVVASASLLRL